MPIINPNNTTGLYGIDTTVQVNNTVTGNNLNIIGNAVIGGNVTVGGAISAAGNITGDYILGNGSQLTGLPEVYGNANVSAYLASGDNTANMITTGNIAGTYFIGNGSQLTGIQANYNDSNVATFLASFGSNTISTTGNITGGYILGNGSQLTGLPATYDDANVVTLLASFGSNTISTTGNITAGNFIGSISNAVYATQSGSTLDISTDTTPVLGGSLNAGGYNISNATTVTATTVNATDTVQAPSVYATTNLYMNNASGTINSSGTISATGNITTVSGQFKGSGAGLTSIPGANVSGTVANAAYATTAGTATTATTATSATTAGTVTTAAQPNITSVGTLTSLAVTGNITGANINGNGSGLSSITGANVTGTVSAATTATTAGTVTTAAQPNITSVGTLSSLAVTGNITGSNIAATTLLTAPQIVTTGSSGNISNVNYITASYFVGDGSLLTNIPGGTYGNSNVISLLANLTPYPIVTTGNITGGNFITTGVAGKVEASGNITGANIFANAIISSAGSVQAGTLMFATGNITGGNLKTGGFVTATGNVIGGNITTTGVFAGSGAELTNIPGANVTGTVPSATSATTAGTVTTAAQPNITSVGTLSSLAVTGNISTSGYFLGDGSQLTNLPGGTPGGSDTQVQFNNAGAFAGDSLFTWDTGNAIANISNVSISNQQILPVNAYATPTTSNNPGRIVIGNGYNGDISTTYDISTRARNAQLAVWLSHEQDNVTGQAPAAIAQVHATPTANITSNQSRVIGQQSVVQIGGGENNYEWQQTLPFAINGYGSLLQIGNTGSATVGNTRVTTALAGGAGWQVNPGSTAGNLYGMLSAPTVGGNVDVSIGYGVYGSYLGSGAVGEHITYYHPTNTTTYNSSINNVYRQAPNGYWAFKNDDAVATVQLGSLKQYHEFTYTNNSVSGDITIDKNNGQVQQITPTGAITSVAFSNFVTTASNGSTTYTQSDTVTLIVAQGATGYAVTLPSSSEYHYLNNNSTVDTTANSISIIKVTATEISSTVNYIIDITTTSAPTPSGGGETISPLMLMGG